MVSRKKNYHLSLFEQTYFGLEFIINFLLGPKRERGKKKASNRQAIFLNRSRQKQSKLQEKPPPGVDFLESILINTSDLNIFVIIRKRKYERMF